MIKLKLIACILILFSTQVVFSQDKTTENKNEKKDQIYMRSIIHYPFSNATAENVELLRAEVETLQFVTKAKTEFKEEKSAGQLIVVIEQITYQDEAEHEEFDSRKLKELITSKGFIPGNIKVENSTFTK